MQKHVVSNGSCEVSKMKCPEEFDFFCSCEKDLDVGYYIHIPAWILKAMRMKDPRGYFKVHFSKKGMMHGYTHEEASKIQKNIKEYTNSESYRRLRRKMKQEAKNGMG